MKVLNVVRTQDATDVWLSGEKIAHFSPLECLLRFEINGKKATVGIKTIGKKKKKQEGEELDLNTPIRKLITREQTKEYVGFFIDIPDITLAELHRKVKELLETKASADFTEEEWGLYHLEQIFGLHPELLKPAYKPKYVETNLFEGYDCPLSYNGKETQPFIVLENTDSCVWQKGAILIAYHLPERKVNRLKERPRPIRSHIRGGEI